MGVYFGLMWEYAPILRFDDSPSLGEAATTGTMFGVYMTGNARSLRLMNRPPLLVPDWYVWLGAGLAASGAVAVLVELFDGRELAGATVRLAVGLVVFAAAILVRRWRYGMKVATVGGDSRPAGEATSD